MGQNVGGNGSKDLEIIGSEDKVHGWGWHALMVGNVWVSLPVLTLAGLWAGAISTNLILIAGILGSVVGGIFPWIGGYIGSKYSLPNTLLSRAAWGTKGGVISSITTIMAGIGWYATHLLLTALDLTPEKKRCLISAFSKTGVVPERLKASMGISCHSSGGWVGDRRICSNVG